MVSPSLTAECTMAWKAKYVDCIRSRQREPATPQRCAKHIATTARMKAAWLLHPSEGNVLFRLRGDPIHQRHQGAGHNEGQMNCDHPAKTIAIL